MRRKGEVKYEENKATFEGWEWLGKFAGIWNWGGPPWGSLHDEIYLFLFW